MRPIALFLALCLSVMFVPGAQAQPKDMKATAPEKMTPPGDAKKMRACDDKAMQMKIPMEQKADFVNKCMAEMK